MSSNPLNADSFCGYSNLAERWDTIVGTPGVGGPGRSGAQCVSFAPGESIGLDIPAIGSFYCGFALKMPSLPDGNMQIFCALNGSAWQLGLRVDPSGHLILGVGESAGEFATTLATSTLVLGTGIWYYVEIKGVISPTAGVAEVMVNGQLTFATVTGANTSSDGTSQIDNYWIGQREQGYTTISMADHYFLDAGGSAPNGYQGNCQVLWQQPALAGSNTDWSPKGGAVNYQNVDETPADGDATYNTSDTPGQMDTFNKPGLPSDVGSVAGALLVARVRADNGAPVMHLVVDSGGTLSESPDIDVPLNYVTVKAPFAIDPATGVAFTPAGFSAVEIGYKDISN